MTALEGEPSPHRWNQIRRLALHPGIQTLEHYEESVLKGTLDALDYLRGIEPLRSLAILDIQQAHFQVFQGAHPWAGEFRIPGQLATIAGYPAADPHRITRELEVALLQMREWIEPALTAGDPLGALTAIAFFHVRFERVHPFVDGNGRSGRVILAIQFEKLFGVLPSFTDQAGYRASMRASGRRDLAPLVNYLGRSTKWYTVQGPIRPPFNVAPRFLNDLNQAPTLEEDLNWARTS